VGTTCRDAGATYDGHGRLRITVWIEMRQPDLAGTSLLDDLGDLLGAEVSR
jgi:hypothetical protein